MNYLSRIPRDILNIIFEFCSDDTLFQLLKTCKQMNEMIFPHYHFAKNIPIFQKPIIFKICKKPLTFNFKNQITIKPKLKISNIYAIKYTHSSRVKITGICMSQSLLKFIKEFMSHKPKLSLTAPYIFLYKSDSIKFQLKDSGWNFGIKDFEKSDYETWIKVNKMEYYQRNLSDGKNYYFILELGNEIQPILKILGYSIKYKSNIKKFAISPIFSFRGF